MSAHEPRSAGGYERSDARARSVFLSGIVLVLVLAVAMVVSARISRRMTAEVHEGEVLNPIRALQQPPEGPALQAVPAQELAAHRAWEEHVLGATEWIDPINKVVRLPVERAMELVLEEGFPVRAEGGK